MQAVVEVPAFQPGSSQPWPVAPVPALSWLGLNAGCTDEEAGLFVATLAHRLDVPSPAGRDEVLDTLFAEECLIVAGGLRLTATATAMSVAPGCCAGLENWRDWARVAAGESPWLGHDPGPEVEFVGEDLRVWQDGGPNRHRGRWADRNVVVPRPALPDLLKDVQRDLLGFLAALEAWGSRIGLGERGTALVDVVDRNFHITRPLDLPAVGAR
jgi:hypothetical protein